mgnify:CR=1 FL=1
MEFDRAYTAKEIANMLGVSQSAVYEWARMSPEAGGLPSFKFGSSVRIRESDLQKWLAERRRA